MASPRAFLSYTRTDDEFFGGAISALRKALELGVRVVTGDKTFQIFHDVDGIDLGQLWEERLEQALAEATFLIPIVTPLFFSSDACRRELTRFMAKEGTARRNDLILPIYFVTTPLLENPDFQKDSLALVLSRRQRWDWRPLVDHPITNPEVRHEIRIVSEQIARAIDRANYSAALPPLLEREREQQFKDNSEAIKKAGQPRRKKPARKVILWVDDKPESNALERVALERYRLELVLATSTEQALEKLSKQRFDAIVSDMGRPPDYRAGYTLLDAVRTSGNLIPYFIYAGSRAPPNLAEVQRRGAQGATNVANELIRMILTALRPEARASKLSLDEVVRLSECKTGSEPAQVQELLLPEDDALP